MPKVLGLVLGMLAGGSVLAQARVSPDRNEIYNYVLTMDTVHKIAAVQKTLEKTSPDVAKPGGKLKTIDDIVQAMHTSPAVMSALKANGLTPRDYALGSLALVRAMMAVAYKRAGAGGANMYSALARDVSPANQALVEQHFDELRGIFDHNGSSRR